MSVCIGRDCPEDSLPGEAGCARHQAIYDRVKKGLGKRQPKVKAKKPPPPVKIEKTAPAPRRKKLSADQVVAYVTEKNGATCSEIAAAFEVSERTSTRRAGEAVRDGRISGGWSGYVPKQPEAA